jgi:hypothetical protein
MKKIIRITESDLVRLVKKVIKEENDSTDQEVFPSKGKAYHLTPDIYLDKIKREGLTPRTESKMTSHPERIYMYLNPESSFKTLAGDLWSSSKYKDQVENYYILMVDLTQLPDHHFYNDPDSAHSYLGVYTTQSIPPSAIKVIEKIPVEDLKPSAPMDDEPIENPFKDSSPSEVNKWDSLLKRLEEK